MNTFFQVVLNYTKEHKDGTLQRTNENFILNATSFTDAEARIYKEVIDGIRGECIVKKISKLKVADIFMYEDGDKWFETKVVYIMEDADSGKERKIANRFIVNANTITEALIRTGESLTGFLVTYSIESIKDIKCEEVFFGEGYQETLDVEVEINEAVEA